MSHAIPISLGALLMYCDISCCCFLKKVNVAYHKYAIKMFDIMHIPGLLGWLKRSDIETVQISII